MKEGLSSKNCPTLGPFSIPCFEAKFLFLLSLYVNYKCIPCNLKTKKWQFRIFEV